MHYEHLQTMIKIYSLSFDLVTKSHTIENRIGSKFQQSPSNSLTLLRIIWIHSKSLREIALLFIKNNQTCFASCSQKTLHSKPNPTLRMCRLASVSIPYSNLLLVLLLMGLKARYELTNNMKKSCCCDKAQEACNRTIAFFQTKQSFVLNHSRYLYIGKNVV